MSASRKLAVSSLVGNVRKPDFGFDLVESYNDEERMCFDGLFFDRCRFKRASAHNSLHVVIQSACSLKFRRLVAKISTMNSAGNARSIPDGWHSVTPRIVVEQAEQLVDFVKLVFSAVGEYQSDRPAILNIGDSKIMISDAGVRQPMPAFLYVYVADADEIYRRAVQAGATPIEEPSDTPYGDRRGMVDDKWGNRWQIATYKKSEGRHDP
jgi:PhnB protein